MGTIRYDSSQGQNSNPEEDMTPPAVKKKKNESRTKVELQPELP